MKLEKEKRKNSFSISGLSLTKLHVLKNAIEKECEEVKGKKFKHLIAEEMRDILCNIMKLEGCLNSTYDPFK